MKTLKKFCNTHIRQHYVHDFWICSLFYMFRRYTILEVKIKFVRSINNRLYLYKFISFEYVCNEIFSNYVE